MDTKENVSPEELAAEQAATQEIKEEEIRAGIIEEFGFDEAADADRIDKLVQKEVDGRKRLSSAIGQKIKHRTEAAALKAKIPPVEKPTQKKTEENELSQKDWIAISRSNVHEEDIDDVVEYAHFKKISIADALKSTVVKATLAEKEEFRKTANAANAGRTPRSTSKPTSEKIMADLDAGKVPEPGSEEAEAVFWARRGGKKK